MRFLMKMRPQRLADQHVAFATGHPVVEIRRRQIAQLILIRQFMRHIAERAAQAIVGPAQQTFQGAGFCQFIAGKRIYAHVLLNPLNMDPNQVVEPYRDRRRIDLGPLSFQPAMNIVVWIALDRLQVKFASDLYDGLRPQAVDLDRLELLEDILESLSKVVSEKMPDHDVPTPTNRGASAEYRAEVVDTFLYHSIGLAGFQLIGPSLILQALQHIGAEQSPNCSRRKRHVDLKAAARHVALAQIGLFHEKDTK